MPGFAPPLTTSPFILGGTTAKPKNPPRSAGGTAGPRFKTLGRDEKLWRIDFAQKVGRLTPEKAAAAKRYWHLDRPAPPLPKGRKVQQASLAPYVAPKKPSFETVLKAGEGDHQAQRQLYLWEKHQQAQKEAVQQTTAIRDRAIFGGSEKTVYGASKAISPLGNEIIKALSPVENARLAYKEGRKGDYGPAAVSALGILPFGPGKFFKGGKAISGIAKAERVAKELTSTEKMREGVKGARSLYGKQKVLRSEELTQRSAAVDEIFRTVTDPEEAHTLARQAMRGELPKIEFNGLRDFTPQLVTELKGIAQHHPALDSLPFQRRRLLDAIDKAHSGGIPTPSDLALIESVFGRQTSLSMAMNAAIRGGFGDKVINALNIPRTLMATFDLSAVARQGLVAGSSHPLLASRAIVPMIRAFKNPAYYEKMMQEIKNDPLYNLALAGKVSFTDLGHETALIAHEEAFASDYAAKIPGIGHAVKGSGRAYTGYLNKLRMDLFKNQIRIAQAAGTNYNDERFLRDIGKVINAATGRGTIGTRAEHIMPALNTLLFSPRLMLSRINYLNPVWYARLHPQARIEALRGLFATTGAVSSVIYLASRIPGVKVGSHDPRSPDFGKLRVGNTRIDIAAGFQQYIRLASELSTNTKVSSTTGKKYKLGSKYGIPTRLDESVNFLFNKAAPPVSISMNILRGHDPVGNPTTPRSIAANNFVPLILQDTIDLYKEHHGGLNGLEWAAGGFGIGIWGVGLQTYKPRKTAPPSTGGRTGKPIVGGYGGGSGGFDFGGSGGGGFQLGGTISP